MYASIMKKNSNQMWRLKRWQYLSKFLTITIANLVLVTFETLQRNLKLKFRSKFNHGFTNHGYLNIAVWKALHNTDYTKHLLLQNIYYTKGKRL